MRFSHTILVASLTELHIQQNAPQKLRTAFTLWCRSSKHHQTCIVAVQHSHSGEIDMRIARNFYLFYFCNLYKPQTAQQKATKATLKMNCLKDLESVQLCITWKWEHWMIQ
jgi:hypothetical protein